MRLPEYTLSFAPRWNNGCYHDEEEYLFTVTYQPFTDVAASRERDVYLWKQDEQSDQTRLCVRYGDDDHQYMSLPDLSDFLYLMVGSPDINTDDSWAVVADAILNHCTLTAKLNSKTRKKKDLWSATKGA